MLLPSIKANSCLALRRILNAEQTGCDAFGPGELEAALRTGTDPQTISLNGPMKSERLLERAISRGVRITLDSRTEFDRTRAVAARLGIRATVRFRFRPELNEQDAASEMSPDNLDPRRRTALQGRHADRGSAAVTAAEIGDPNWT